MSESIRKHKELENYRQMIQKSYVDYISSEENVVVIPLFMDESE